MRLGWNKPRQKGRQTDRQRHIDLTKTDDTMHTLYCFALP